MIPLSLISTGLDLFAKTTSSVINMISDAKAQNTAESLEKAKILEEKLKCRQAYKDSVVGALGVLYDEQQGKMNDADKQYKSYVEKIRQETAAFAKSDKMGGTFYGIIKSFEPFTVLYSNKVGAESKVFDSSIVYKTAYKYIFNNIVPTNLSAQTDIILAGYAEKKLREINNVPDVYQMPDKFDTTKGGQVATVDILLGRASSSSMPMPMPNDVVDNGTVKNLEQPKTSSTTILIILGVIGVAAYYFFSKKKKK
jgi:hypothetical protein